MRLDNWQTRLGEVIEANKEKPFDFATHNCLLWAGLVTEAVTGKNIAEEAIGNSATEAAGYRFLVKRLKSATVFDFLQRELGTVEQSVAFARTGDIVFLDPVNLPEFDIKAGGKFGIVPGVCYGQKSYFLGELGLVEVQTLRLDCALWVL